MCIHADGYSPVAFGAVFVLQMGIQLTNYIPAAADCTSVRRSELFAVLLRTKQPGLEQHFILVFGMFSVRIAAEIPIFFTEGFSRFPQSFQTPG
jgi:hypothetical protein